MMHLHLWFDGSTKTWLCYGNTFPRTICISKKFKLNFQGAIVNTASRLGNLKYETAFLFCVLIHHVSVCTLHTISSIQTAWTGPKIMQTINAHKPFTFGNWSWCHVKATKLTNIERYSLGRCLISKWCSNHTVRIAYICGNKPEITMPLWCLCLIAQT